MADNTSACTTGTANSRPSALQLVASPGIEAPAFVIGNLSRELCTYIMLPCVSCALAPRRSTTPVKTVRGKKTVRESIDTKRTVSNTRTARGVKQQTDSRRQLPPQQQQQQKHGSRFYLFFTGFPFPIGPFWERKTCRYEVGHQQ